MNISFYPSGKEYLWFIFDENGKTIQKGFENKNKAMLWLSTRKIR
jgi:hypothetical protein